MYLFKKKKSFVSHRHKPNYIFYTQSKATPLNSVLLRQEKTLVTHAVDHTLMLKGFFLRDLPMSASYQREAMYPMSCAKYQPYDCGRVLWKAISVTIPVWWSVLFSLAKSLDLIKAMKEKHVSLGNKMMT